MNGYTGYAECDRDRGDDNMKSCMQLGYASLAVVGMFIMYYGYRVFQEDRWNVFKKKVI